MPAAAPSIVDLHSIARASASYAGEAAPLVPAEAKNYDVFISHATEDKDAVVRPLAEALSERGLSVWYDEFALRVGSSLRQRIDYGLANSRFGVVVLSEAFFAKPWTNYELDGLVTRDLAAGGGQIILPIWHRVSKDDVMGYSPTLADRLALTTATSSIAEIASELAEVIVSV